MKELYRLDSKGKMRVWNIEVCNLGTSSEIRIRSGIWHGKMTTQIIVVSSGKNIGKVNETTHYEQAEKEMDSRITAQLRSGYVEDPENLRSNTELGSGLKKPMLAQKYDPTGKQKGSKTLSLLGIAEGDEVAVQPKLDGVRGVAVVSANEAKMYTREGDLMPVQPTNVLDDLHAQFQDVYTNFDKEVIVDGELYAHQGLSFNELNGLLRKVDASPEQLEKRKRVKYHIYDVMLDKGFQERWDFVSSNFRSTDNIELVRTDFVPAQEAELRTWLEGVLAQGYEGLIIRQLGNPYEHKRTWQLLKYKQFEDDEFKLIGFEEDKRGGFAARFTLELPEPVTDRDGKVITTFGAGASGQTEAQRKYMWEHPEEFVGKIATVKFFGRSEYGVPRFAKFKGFVK